jgi:hypothetical protein
MIGMLHYCDAVMKASPEVQLLSGIASGIVLMFTLIILIIPGKRRKE